MPSTSLIAIIARCTTIQFADCAQPTRMNNPRNPDRTHGRNETSHIKTEPCIARRGSWAATPRAPSSGPPPASTCPHAAEKWAGESKAGEGSRGEGKGGVLLEEGLDLSGLLLDAGDDGLQVLVRVGVRRRRSHPAGAGDTEGGVGCRGCYEKEGRPTSVNDWIRWTGSSVNERIWGSWAGLSGGRGRCLCSPITRERNRGVTGHRRESEEDGIEREKW